MKEGVLTLVIKDPVEKHEIPIKVSDETESHLLAYISQAKEVNKSKFVRSPMTFRLEWSRDQGQRTITELPDNETLGGFLHLFRPIILEKEPYSFVRTQAQIARLSDNSGLRAVLKAINAQWSLKARKDFYVIRDSSGVQSDDKALKRFLNAFEYHRDDAKAETLRELEAMLGSEGMRASFLFLLGDKCSAAFKLAKLSEQILGLSNDLAQAEVQPD